MEQFFLGTIPSKEKLDKLVYNRWIKKQLPTLSHFAPYAGYFVKVNYLFLIGLHAGLVTPRRSNVFDIHYLYYLPFCMVFSSSDKFHKALFPLLSRKDQEFVDGDDLKKDLCWIADEWKNLSENEKEDRAYNYGSYPPKNEASITYRLWKKYMPPWKPGSGNKAIRMTKEEHERSFQRLKPMRDAVDNYLKTKNRLHQS